ncbi:MAG: hypothetical protein L6R35_000975 [Caloplaca aegaea]|nr:MAG: hypothetical protein L6R35_000975 [Caloplaca aegaea]
MAGTSKITDWAEQQSSQSSTSLWTPPSQDSGQAALPEKTATPTIYTRRSMRRVYSIATLLKLGQTKQLAHVELRISPAALAENVFKITSAPLRSRLQENLHPRRQTQSSSFTGRSTNTEEDVMYDSTYVRPLRQPINPPEVSLIQKHAGFARFLKQHASPPHHRVTAGGRIVPAGPLSPPPMMDMASINAIMNNSDKSSTAKPLSSIHQGERKGPGNIKVSAGMSAVPLAQQHTNVNHLHQKQEVANAQYAQMQPPLLGQSGSAFGPFPVGATPIGFLPDGSSIVFYNGVHYQSSWDGRGSVMKPLPLPTPALPQMLYNSNLYTQMAAGAQYYDMYGLNGQARHQGISPPLPTSNNTSEPPEEHPHIPAAQSRSPQTLRSQLASELSTLDKFAALHLHEFSSAESAHYSSRRRELVEQLDNLRVMTENNRFIAQPNEPSHGMQAVPYWMSASHIMGGSHVPQVDGGSGGVPSTPANTRAISAQLPNLGLNQRLAPTQVSTNKCLSPDAPPFIPSGTRPTIPGYFGNGQSLPQTGLATQGKIQGNNALHGSTTATGPSGRTAYALTDKPKSPSDGYLAQPNQSSKASRHVVSGSYSSVETGTIGALPVVTSSEIQYTHAPGFNPAKAAKRYCTTIGEFQEVLRRVREQAQLYGCKGGQSKDPAYDAEQDVRWAMADSEPIPLPKFPADHVAHPRPWSWDDSAFNHRPTVAISPIGSKCPTDDEAHQSLNLGSNARSRADSWATNPSDEDFNVERGARLAHLHEQFRPYLEDVSESSAKLETHHVPRFPATDLSKQPSGAQEVYPSPKGDMGASQRWTAHPVPQNSDFAGRDSPVPTSQQQYPLTLLGNCAVATPSRQLGVVGSPWSNGDHRNAAHIASPGSGLTTRQNKNWDRDSDTLSFDSQGIPRSHLKDSSKPLSCGASSEGFLREMLRSPRFSAGRNHQSEPYGMANSEMLVHEGTQGERTRPYKNKENVKSEGYPNFINWYQGLSKANEDSFKWNKNTDADPMANKAPSSLAASSYHAFGQLPQYDGAGDAMASGSSPQRKTRMDKESEPTKGLSDDQGKSRAAMAEAYDVGPTETYDYRGLTRKAFTAASDRPSNARVHRQTVDRFLSRIAEEELNEVAASYGRKPIIHPEL